ncbi:50S ribosomal protein L29 [Candidatus Aerophobetes bacterium]|uniref:Large ribosomal subunit protein uL29 n=1 Tax=Aerophobetes bacterium TaxID=2030807 RepID=A0A523S400_UNCAE|nr:MAG: 50S ribosomal protein L29 [Candidatus Aerophobetes bacterium]
MKVEELRDLSKEDLYERLKDVQRELFDLKIVAAQGKATNPSKIREIKKTIPRIKTLLREKEIKLGRRKA